MVKYRPLTPPILGQQISRIEDRLDENERNRTGRSGAPFAAGGSPGFVRTPENIQSGKGTTDVNGELAVTFATAYDSADNISVVATPLNTGTDLIVCSIKTLSTTGVTITAEKIKSAGTTPQAQTGPGTPHSHAPGTFTAASHSHSPGTFAAAAHDHAPGTFAAAAHDHAPGTFSVTIPAGTNGSSGTFGVANVSAQSGPHSVSGVSASSGPHSVSGTSASSGPHAVSGVSAEESSHTHSITDYPAHSHDREKVEGVTIYWIAMPKTQ